MKFKSEIKEIKQPLQSARHSLTQEKFTVTDPNSGIAIATTLQYSTDEKSYLAVRKSIYERLQHILHIGTDNKITQYGLIEDDQYFLITIENIQAKNHKGRQIFEYFDSFGKKIAEAIYDNKNLLVRNISGRKINFKVKILGNYLIENLIIENVDSAKRPSGNISIVVDDNIRIDVCTFIGKKLDIPEKTSILATKIYCEVQEMIIEGAVKSSIAKIHANKIINNGSLIAQHSLHVDAREFYNLAYLECYGHIAFKGDYFSNDEQSTLRAGKTADFLCAKAFINKGNYFVYGKSNVKANQVVMSALFDAGIASFEVTEDLYLYNDAALIIAAGLEINAKSMCCINANIKAHRQSRNFVDDPLNNHIKIKLINLELIETRIDSEGLLNIDCENYAQHQSAVISNSNLLTINAGELTVDTESLISSGGSINLLARDNIRLAAATIKSKQNIHITAPLLTSDAELFSASDITLIAKKIDLSSRSLTQATNTIEFQSQTLLIDGVVTAKTIINENQLHDDLEVLVLGAHANLQADDKIRFKALNIQIEGQLVSASRLILLSKEKQCIEETARLHAGTRLIVRADILKVAGSLLSDSAIGLKSNTALILTRQAKIISNDLIKIVAKKFNHRGELQTASCTIKTTLQQYYTAKSNIQVSGLLRIYGAAINCHGKLHADEMVIHSQAKQTYGNAAQINVTKRLSLIGEVIESDATIYSQGFINCLAQKKLQLNPSSKFAAKLGGIYEADIVSMHGQVVSGKELVIRGKNSVGLAAHSQCKALGILGIHTNQLTHAGSIAAEQVIIQAPQACHIDSMAILQITNKLQLITSDLSIKAALHLSADIILQASSGQDIKIHGAGKITSTKTAVLVAKAIAIDICVQASETICVNGETLHVLSKGKLLNEEANFGEMRQCLKNKNSCKQYSANDALSLVKQPLFHKSIQLKNLKSMVVDGEVSAGLILDCHLSSDLTINASGKLKAGVELNCFAENLFNAGTIECDGTANIGLNRPLINGITNLSTLNECYQRSYKPTIAAKRLNITAPIIVNIVGQLSAIQSLQCSALVYINLGLTTANVSATNALMVLDMGVNLPNIDELSSMLNKVINFNFSELCAEMLSGKGQMALVEALKFIFASQRSVIMFASMAYTVAINLRNIIQTINSTYKKTINLRDLIPLLVGVKDLATNAHHAYNMSHLAAEAFQKTLNSSVADIIYAQRHLHNLMDSALPFIPAPSHYQDSLIGVRGPGVTVSMNTSVKSLVSANLQHVEVANRLSNHAHTHYAVGIYRSRNIAFEGVDLILKAHINSHDIQIALTGVFKQLANSVIESDQAMIQAESLNQQGKIHLLSNVVKVALKGAHTIEEGAELKMLANPSVGDAQTAFYEAGTLDIKGLAQVQNAFLKVNGATRIIDNGQLQTSGRVTLQTNTLELISDLPPLLDHDHIFSEGHLKLQVNETLSVAKHTRISGENVVVDTKDVRNNGEIRLSGSLALAADTLINYGTIDTKADGVYNVEYLINNSGSINGANISVNTALFANLLGSIHATNNLNTNSLLYFDVGLTRAFNRNSNSILALDFGVHLPSISSRDQIFNSSMGLRAAKELASFAYAPLSSFINLASSAYNAGKLGYHLSDQFASLDFSNLKTSQVVALMANVKDLASAGTNTYNSARSAVNDFNKNGDHRPFEWQDFSQRAGSFIENEFNYLSSANIDSVFSVRSGVSVSGSANYRSLFAAECSVNFANSMSSYAAFGQYVSGDYFGKHVSLTGGDLLLNANIDAAVNINIKGNLNIGNATLTHLQAKADTVINRGQLKVAGDIGINANKYAINLGSVSATNISITAPLYLNLWSMSATNNLNIKSLVAIDLGLTRAFNASVSSLFSFKLGITLPNITSWSQLLQPSFALRATKALLIATYAPVGTLVNLAESAYHYTSEDAQSGYRKLYSAVVSADYKNMEMSEAINLMVDVKGFVSTTTNLYSSIQPAINDFNTIITDAAKVLDRTIQAQPQKKLILDVKDSVYGNMQKRSGAQPVDPKKIFDKPKSPLPHTPADIGIQKLPVNNKSPRPLQKMSSDIKDSAYNNMQGYSGPQPVDPKTIFDKSKRHSPNGEMGIDFSHLSYIPANTKSPASQSYWRDEFENFILSELSSISSLHEDSLFSWRGRGLTALGSAHYNSLYAADIGHTNLSFRMSSTAIARQYVGGKNIVYETGIYGGDALLDTDLNNRVRVKLTGELSQTKNSNITSDNASIHAKTINQSGVIAISSGNSAIVSEGLHKLNNGGELDLSAGASQNNGEFVSAGKATRTNAFVKTQGEYKTTQSSKDDNTETLFEMGSADRAGDIKDTKVEMHSQKDIKFAIGTRLGVKDSYYKSKEGSINYGADGKFTGNNAFIAHQTMTTEKDSKMTGNGSVYMEGKKEDLNGAISVAKTFVKFDQIDNVNDMIQGKGKYNNFKPTSQLGIDTKGEVILEGFNDTRDIAVAADKLTTAGKITTTKTIALESKTDTNNINDDVKGSEVYLKSALDVNIKGATVQGLNHVTVIAKRNVNLENARKPVQGRYDIEMIFTPARILGGKGVGFDGIGTYVKAGRSINLKASTIASIGHNVLSAQKDIKTTYDAHTGISSKQKKRGVCSKQVKTVSDTQIARSAIVSSSGQNILLAQDGTLHATATDFVAKQGNYAKCNGDLQLREAIGVREVTKSKKSFGGLLYKKEHRKDEFASGVTIIDSAQSHFESVNGSVLGTGVNVYSPGVFNAIAEQGQVKFGVTKLNHSYTRESRTVNLGGRAVDHAKALSSGFTPQKFIQMDPVLRDFQQAFNSSNGLLSQSFSSANAMMSSYNLYQQLTQTGLANTFLSNAGLGDGVQFNPRVTIGLNEQTTQLNYQSASAASFNTGGVNLVANKNQTAELEGVEKNIKGDMRVKAQKFIDKGVELASSFSTKQREINIGLNLSGVTDVGVKASNSQSTSTHWQPSRGGVDGRLILDVDEMRLDASVLNVKKVHGRADIITIVTRQDTTQQSSSSVSFDTAGNVAYSQSKSSEKTTSAVSGLHVQDGINTDEKYRLDTKEVNLIGGKITTEGENRLAAEVIHATSVVDTSKSTTRGFATNVNTILPNKTNDQKDVLHTGIQTLASITLSDAKKVTQHLATVAGDAGTHLDVKRIEGELNQNPNQATKVLVDQKQVLDIRIPNIAPLIEKVMHKPVEEHAINSSGAKLKEVSAETKDQQEKISSTTEHVDDDIDFTKVTEKTSLPNFLDVPDGDYEYGLLNRGLDTVDFLVGVGKEYIDHKLHCMSGVWFIKTSIAMPIHGIALSVRFLDELDRGNPNAGRDAIVRYGIDCAVDSAVAATFGPINFILQPYLMAGRYWADYLNQDNNTLKPIYNLQQDVMFNPPSKQASFWENIFYYQLRHELNETIQPINAAANAAQDYDAAKNKIADSVIQNSFGPSSSNTPPAPDNKPQQTQTPPSASLNKIEHKFNQNTGDYKTMTHNRFAFFASASAQKDARNLIGEVSFNRLPAVAQTVLVDLMTINSSIQKLSRHFPEVLQGFKKWDPAKVVKGLELSLQQQIKWPGQTKKRIQDHIAVLTALAEHTKQSDKSNRYNC